jgi:hypothetical protein
VATGTTLGSTLRQRTYDSMTIARATTWKERVDDIHLDGPLRHLNGLGHIFLWSACGFNAAPGGDPRHEAAGLQRRGDRGARTLPDAARTATHGMPARPESSIQPRHRIRSRSRVSMGSSNGGPAADRTTVSGIPKRVTGAHVVLTGTHQSAKPVARHDGARGETGGGPSRLPRPARVHPQDNKAG